MASTEGSGILETGNLETAKRALDAEGFRHFQILRLVFKSEMTRCAQAHPSRAKALQIQIARRGLGPLRGRSNSASRRAHRPCAARGRLIIMPWRRCRRKRTPGRWRTTSCFLGSRQRPFLSTFFGAFNGYIPYLTSRQQDGCAGIVVRRGVRCGARRGDAPPNAPEPVCGNQKGRRRLVRWLILCHCRSLCRQATVNVKRVAAGCIVIV